MTLMLRKAFRVKCSALQAGKWHGQSGATGAWMSRLYFNKKLN